MASIIRNHVADGIVGDANDADRLLMVDPTRHEPSNSSEKARQQPGRSKSRSGAEFLKQGQLGPGLHE